MPTQADVSRAAIAYARAMRADGTEAERRETYAELQRVKAERLEEKAAELRRIAEEATQ